MYVNASMLNNICNNNTDNSTSSFLDVDELQSKASSTYFVKSSDSTFEDSSKANFTYNSNLTEAEEELMNMDSGVSETVSDAIENLKNEFTPDVFDEMSELGIIADEEDPANIVTVTERIQIELATHCENYKGSTSNISKEDLQECTGNDYISQTIQNKMQDYNVSQTTENIDEAQQAYDMYSDIEEVDSDVSAYLTKNDKSPTIDNVYKAKYSVSGEQNTNKNLSENEWSSLKEQIGNVLSNSNLEVNDENLSTAKTLLESDIPVTADNILNYQDIENIDLSKPAEEVIDNIVRTMAYGEDADNTLITENQISAERVNETISVLENVTDEQLQTLVDEGNDINVLGIKNSVSSENVDYSSVKLLEAKQTLLETNLMMTTEAGIKMLKNGIRIETQPVEDMLEELKTMKNEMYQNLAAMADTTLTSDQITEADQTLTSVENINSAPVEVLGMVLKKEIEFTVQDVSESGEALKEKMIQASESYETLGTQVRTDLGDSYSKAFESIDAILDDLDIESTESSKRAVKILSYNQMDITQESVTEVKELYSEVKKLTNNLTPMSVVNMLKEGINPLETNITELNDSLEQMNEEIGASKEDKYSEFLWKMDNSSSQLSDEDREAYVGMFRLMNLMEKDGYQALGYVMSNGADMTLKNMVSAVKSKRAKGMDVSISDTTQDLKDIYHGKNLNDQLQAFESNSVNTTEMKYNQNLLTSSINNMTPESLTQIFSEDFSEMTLENIAETIEDNTETNQKYHSDYEYERVMKYLEGNEISGETAKQLMSAGKSASILNQVSMSMLTKGSKGIYQNLEEETGELDEEISLVEDSIDNEDELNEAVSNLSQKTKEILEEKVDTEDIDTLDLKNIKLVNSGFQLLENMSRDKNYQLPVEINGEIVAFNLTVIEGGEETGKIKIEFEDNEIGTMRAELQMSDNKLSGNLYASTQESKNIMTSTAEEFKSELEENDFEAGNINVIQFEELGKGIFSKEEQSEDSQSQQEKTGTADLFKISKIFISAAKKSME